MSHGTASLLGGRPVFQGGDVPNAITIPLANTGGLQLFNTADQTTNYERLEMLWDANIATLRMAKGGTGTNRTILISTPLGNSLQLRAANDTSGQFRFFGASSAGAGTYYAVFVGTNSATSGSNGMLIVSPTYNQASGTADNTDLLVNRTETAIGSGAQRLMSLQVGGVERFGVSNAGAVVMANQTSGPGAATGTLTNAPSVGNPDFWLPVSINGTPHWIPAWAA